LCFDGVRGTFTAMSTNTPTKDTAQAANSRNDITLRWIVGGLGLLIVIGMIIRTAAVATILSASAWPFVVLVIAWWFRSPLDAFLVGLGHWLKIKLTLPGGMAIEAERGPEEEKTPTALQAVSAVDDAAKKPANMFWLGSDLMAVFAWLVLGAERGRIEWQLGKAIQHLKQIHQENTDPGKGLIRIADEISTTSNWSQAQREAYAERVRQFAWAIGRNINDLQPGAIL
jgi:hypothetical protein